MINPEESQQVSSANPSPADHAPASRENGVLRSVPERQCVCVPLREDGFLVVDLDTRQIVELHQTIDARPRAARKNGFLRNPDPQLFAPLPGSTALAEAADHDGTADSVQVQIDRLRAANRRKDEFLATLSHELRSPLASIQYAVRLLRKQPEETAAQQRVREVIERQLLRTTRIVNDLSDVSRIAHGRLHIDSERIDLRVIVANAIETLEVDITERKHHLTTELPETSVWLHGDACRLEQVFVNLLSNASRYTDAGGELSVSVATSGSQAVVCVRDSGIGITPDALPYIFDLFTQANTADPRSRAGLGIGLAVVRNLLAAHGGSVTATSAGSGKGSEFTVRLPLER
jgi:signal transduction histidine kinase